MSDPTRVNEIVRRVAGAEIVAFPRSAAPASVAPAPATPAAIEPPASSRSGALRDDAAGGGRGDGGHGGDGQRGAGGDDDGLHLRLAMLPRTDLGNAERFVARFRAALRYCPALGWLAWDGRRWKSDGADEAVKRAEHDTVRAIQDEAEALADSGDDVVVTPGTKSKDDVWLSDKVAAWGLASESAARMAAISQRAAALLSIGVDQLNRDPMKINVGNGTLHVCKSTDGSDFVQLRPHDPEDFITVLSPVDYQPEADCPAFKAFLAEVQPTEDVRLFLQQWGGYSLTGDTGEQKMIFLYGKGRNGKGVFVSLLSYVAGEYGDAIPIESFLDSGRARAAGQATPDIADLPGVRCLTTSEPKKGATLDEAFVKLFTGGDMIKARQLGRGYFKFRPQAKLVMQGNYRPKISGTDEGIWNRMVLVPCPVFIPPERRNPKLVDELREEAPGILNFFLDGLRSWLERGLRLPDVVREATQSYRNDSDPLGRFLDACTVQKLGGRVQATALHQLYEAWAKANGETLWSAKGLGNAMSERGFSSVKSSVMYWLDLDVTKRVRDFVDEHGKPWRNEAADDGGEPVEP